MPVYLGSAIPVEHMGGASGPVRDRTHFDLEVGAGFAIAG